MLHTSLLPGQPPWSLGKRAQHSPAQVMQRPCLLPQALGTAQTNWWMQAGEQNIGANFQHLSWSPAGHYSTLDGQLGRPQSWWHLYNIQSATSRNTFSIFQIVEREKLKGQFIHSKSLFQQLMSRFSRLSDVFSSKLLTSEVAVALSRASALCSLCLHQDG